MVLFWITPVEWSMVVGRWSMGFMAVSSLYIEARRQIAALTEARQEAIPRRNGRSTLNAKFSPADDELLLVHLTRLRACLLLGSCPPLVVGR